MAAIAINRLGTCVVVQRIATRVPEKCGASVGIAVFCLTSAHIVGGAIAGRVFHPAADLIRIRAPLTVAYPIIINVSLGCAAVQAVVSGAERRFTTGDAGPSGMPPD